MMLKNDKRKNIAINKLHFWLGNPRLDDYEGNWDDQSIIDFYIDTKQLEKLLEQQIKNFDLEPQEVPVVYENKGKYVVYEGNRRLACYKLLANPSLTHSEDIQARIEAFRNKYPIDSDYNISCIVCSSEQEAKRRVENKHRYDMTLRRNFYERLRYDVLHNISKGNLTLNQKKKLEALIIYMQRPDSGIPKGIQKVIKKDAKNNLRNMLLHPRLWSIFELYVDKDVNLHYSESFKAKFPAIVLDIQGTDDENYNLQMTDDELDEYLANISEQDGKAASKEMVQEASGRNTPLFRDTVLPKEKYPHRTNRFSNKRKFLIPREFKKTLSSKRLRDIFNELKKLRVDEYPNAVAVLFRSFLEFSINDLADYKGHIFDKNKTIKQRIHWIIEQLKAQGVGKKIYERAYRLMSSPYEYLAIEHFHAHVHDEGSLPHGGRLKNIWNNLEPFFDVLLVEKQ